MTFLPKLVGGWCLGVCKCYESSMRFWWVEGQRLTPR
jgi:hypothetical protein